MLHPDYQSALWATCLARFTERVDPSALQELLQGARAGQTEGPFLSIVMRTQGKREEPLREVLLCLSAQTNTDFEVLLMCHKLDKEQRQTVDNILDMLPGWLRQKVRPIAVDHGNRTTPLNEGFKSASGKYTAILDDDDLVFDNWVETFQRLAEEKPGRILHAYSIAQNWKRGATQFADQTLYADGPPNVIYCRDFSLFLQFSANTCPAMSLAFPSYVFQTFGFRFDETLSTTEDWDFLMRTAFFCGVHNAKTPTSIYRWWNNVENSQTLHDRSEWDANYEHILKGFEKYPILLSESDVSVLSAYRVEFAKLTQAESEQSVLYYDNGAGFLEETALRLKNKKAGVYDLLFKDLGSLGALRAIRFDPMEKGGFKLERLRITVAFADGSQREYFSEDVYTNGMPSNDGIVFLKDDPQITIPFAPAAILSSVRVQARLNERLDAGSLDKYYKVRLRVRFERLCRRIKRKLKAKGS